MKRLIGLKRKWLPLALIPMMSVAVLAGCSSDDDDDNGGGVMVTDGDGDGGTDGEGDGGTDGEGDGGTDGEGDGNGTTDPTGTGDLAVVDIGDAGTVNFSWDGANLSGTITTVADAGAVSAALMKGIGPSDDPGMQMIELSGAGPNFEYPTGLSTDQSAPIAAEMAAGNLFVRLQTANGAIDSNQILPPNNAVVATYTVLTPASSVSTGGAHMNVNTITGDYTIYLNVNIDGSDTDENGNLVTMAAAHIHSGAVDGPVIVALEDTGNGTAFRGRGTMDAATLSTITAGDGWFNVHLNDGTTPGASYFSGNISADPF